MYTCVNIHVDKGKEVIEQDLDQKILLCCIPHKEKIQVDNCHHYCGIPLPR